jgi:methyl-accepting chemotaxis protein
MFKNIKLGWKLALLVAITPLVAAVVGGLAFRDVGRVKYEYDNLYGFMLVPIMGVDQGNLQRAELSAAITQLTRADLPAAERQSLIAASRTADQAMSAMIAKYESDWLSTLSPDFTATLAAQGKQSLQTDEASALAQFHQAYTAYAAKRDQLFAGQPVPAADLQADLGQMQAAFDSLLSVNQQFADLSNTSAQAAISEMQWTVPASAGVGSLLAVVLGVIVALGITRPLGRVSGALRDFGRGELNRDLSQAVRDNLSRRGDELGDLARAMGQSEAYMQAMAQVAGGIAAGDLTVEITPRSEKDELGLAFAGMIANLRRLVGQVAESARGVSQASQQLAASAAQAGQATGQIAATVQQVAQGTQQQTQSVTRTAASVEEMKHAIEGVAQGAQEQATAVGQASSVTAQISAAAQQVVASAQTGAHGAADATQVARAGAATIESTVQGMATIRAKVRLSAQKVQEMGARSDQIGAIVETIDDIAGQTNLLALNAAIEAARAGEHGKGFAVVADEVRKLAERASAATKEIGGLIKGIQQSVTEAVAAMDDGAREVELGANRAGESGQALNRILQGVEAVRGQVEQIQAAAEHMGAGAAALVGAVDQVSAVVEANTAATEEMAAGSQEVTRAIENIASVSEENSAAVEEVSASAEEMSAQVEEVTAAAESLSELAAGLRQVVSQFRLSDKPAEPAPRVSSPSHQPASRPPAVWAAYAPVGNGHHAGHPDGHNHAAPSGA